MGHELVELIRGKVGFVEKAQERRLMGKVHLYEVSQERVCLCTSTQSIALAYV